MTTPTIEQIAAADDYIVDSEYGSYADPFADPFEAPECCQ